MPSLVFCPVFTASPESIFPNAESTIQVPPYPQPQASDNPASMRSNVQANRWAIAVDTEDHLAHRKGCWRVVDQCDRERRLGPISGGVGRAHANPKDEIEETVSSRRVPSTIDMDRIARIWGKGDCDKVKTQKSPVIGHNGQLFQLSDFAKESKNDQITRIHTRQGLFVLVERGVDNCPFKSAKSCREANRHSFVVGGSSPIQESSTSNETSGATTPERDGQGEFAAAQAMAKQVPTQKDEPSAGQSLEPWNRDQKVPRYRQIPLRAPHGTPAGQWPGDWACPTCWYINFGRNRRCIKCFPRPRIYQDARPANFAPRHYIGLQGQGPYDEGNRVLAGQAGQQGFRGYVNIPNAHHQGNNQGQALRTVHAFQTGSLGTGMESFAASRFPNGRWMHGFDFGGRYQDGHFRGFNDNA